MENAFAFVLTNMIILTIGDKQKKENVQKNIYLLLLEEKKTLSSLQISCSKEITFSLKNCEGNSYLKRS